MKTRHEPQHLIDFLFPAVLLFVFAFSAISVILLATGVYQDTVRHSARNYTAQTALAYLTEKVHQNDVSGQITLESFDGCPALVLRQSREDQTYVTYLFVAHRELRELFIQDGTAATAEDGRSILDVASLDMEEIGNHSFLFTCTDETGETARAVVHVRSGKGGAKG